MCGERDLDEEGVLGLYAVGVVEKYAFGGHPEVVVYVVALSCECGRVGALGDVGCEYVEGSVDGREAGVIGVLVFVGNYAEDPGLGAVGKTVCAEEGDPEVDEEDIEEVEYLGFGVVVVVRADGIVM